MSPDAGACTLPDSPTGTVYVGAAGAGPGGGTMDLDGTTFGRCRETVREMTVDREPLAEVEEMLVDTPLSSDEKDALWLFSWALGEQQPPGRRRARRSRDHGGTW